MTVVVEWTVLVFFAFFCRPGLLMDVASKKQVQLLSYDMDLPELTEESLTALCTSSCLSSLVQLESAVTSGCGSYEIDFNGAYLSTAQVFDLFAYNMSCLADSSGAFCLMVEESWDVAALNNSGEATWPTFTNKVTIFRYYNPPVQMVSQGSYKSIRATKVL